MIILIIIFKYCKILFAFLSNRAIIFCIDSAFIEFESLIWLYTIYKSATQYPTLSSTNTACRVRDTYTTPLKIVYEISNHCDF